MSGRDSFSVRNRFPMGFWLGRNWRAIVLLMTATSGAMIIVRFREGPPLKQRYAHIGEVLRVHDVVEYERRLLTWRNDALLEVNGAAVLDSEERKSKRHTNRLYAGQGTNAGLQLSIKLRSARAIVADFVRVHRADNKMGGIETEIGIPAQGLDEEARGNQQRKRARHLRDNEDVTQAMALGTAVSVRVPSCSTRFRSDRPARIAGQLAPIRERNCARKRTLSLSGQHAKALVLAPAVDYEILIERQNVGSPKPAGQTDQAGIGKINLAISIFAEDLRNRSGFAPIKLDVSVRMPMPVSVTLKCNWTPEPRHRARARGTTTPVASPTTVSCIAAIRRPMGVPREWEAFPFARHFTPDRV